MLRHKNKIMQIKMSVRKLMGAQIKLIETNKFYKRHNLLLKNKLNANLTKNSTSEIKSSTNRDKKVVNASFKSTQPVRANLTPSSQMSATGIAPPGTRVSGSVLRQEAALRRVGSAASGYDLPKGDNCRQKRKTRTKVQKHKRTIINTHNKNKCEKQCRNFKLSSCSEHQSRQVIKRGEGNKKITGKKTNTESCDSAIGSQPLVSNTLLSNRRTVKHNRQQSKKTSGKTTIITSSLGAGVGGHIREKNTCVYVKRGATLQRIHQDLRKNHAYPGSGKLVFMCGTNNLDIDSLGRTLLAYDDLIDDALQLNERAQIFLTSLPLRWDKPHLNKDIKSLNTYLHAKSKKMARLSFIDNTTIHKRAHYQRDGLHLNNSGQSKLAQNIKSALNFYTNGRNQVK